MMDCNGALLCQDAARQRAMMMAVLGRASDSALPRLWLNRRLKPGGSTK